VNASLWWFLTDIPRQGEGTDNAALTDIDGHYPKRAYVTGQWSKFVRPGWSRIGVSYYFGRLYISAFKEPANQSFAIVVVNPSAKAKSQKFSLNGFSTRSVTPWITSKNLSLAAQPPVAVAGSGFNYTLPAASVTTFDGAVSKTD
jgi:glucuronoarabinoxylan endo-1,4-beta-xylanase